MLELGELVLEAGQAVGGVVRRAVGRGEPGVAGVGGVVCLALRRLEGARGLGADALGVLEGALGGVPELAVGGNPALVVGLQALELGLLGVALVGEVLEALTRACEQGRGVRELVGLHADDLVVVPLHLAAVGELVVLVLRSALELGEAGAGLRERAAGAGELAHGRDALAERAAPGGAERAGVVEDGGGAGVVRRGGLGLGVARVI